MSWGTPRTGMDSEGDVTADSRDMPSPLDIALDSHRPVQDRADAVEDAAREVAAQSIQERAAVWRRLFPLLLDEDAPLEVRTAVARAAAVLGDCCVNNLVARATLESPSVRAAVVASLHAIGAGRRPDLVEGQLVKDLAAFSDELTLQPFVNLTLRYGADPRATAVLHRGVTSRDPDIVRSALLQLAGIGEMAPVIAAAQPGEPDERRIAAVSAMGYYWLGDETSRQALEAAAADPDTEVGNAGRQALRRLGLRAVPRPQPQRAAHAEVDVRFPWHAFLSEWSHALLENADFAITQPDEVVTGGWLGMPPATEAQVVELETRLGRRLPPSYRSFLMTCNGFRGPGTAVSRIRPAQEVRPFVDEEREWADIWTRESGTELSVEEHVRSRGDDVRARWALLYGCVQVSDVGDAAVYLLCPDVVDAEGEWEAWLFATWLPGARRYASWWKLLQAERHDS